MGNSIEENLGISDIIHVGLQDEIIGSFNTEGYKKIYQKNGCWHVYKLKSRLY